MKFIRVFAIAIFFHIVMNLFMPWWNIYIAGLIAGFFSKAGLRMTLLSVFLALTFYWLLLIWTIDSSNAHILGDRISAMLGLGNRWLLITINAMLGGISAMLASYLGFEFKKLLSSQKLAST